MAIQMSSREYCLTYIALDATKQLTVLAGEDSAILRALRLNGTFVVMFVSNILFSCAIGWRWASLVTRHYRRLSYSE